MALPAPGAGSCAMPLTREWRAPFPLDVRLVLSVHRRGPRDPACRVTGDGAVWRTSLTPDGPGTLRVTVLTAVRPAPAASAASGGAAASGSAAAAATRATQSARTKTVAAATVVSATAWGPGAGWLLDSLPSLLGAADDPAGFAPAHPLLRDLYRRHGGLRVGRSGRVLEALVPAILEQKVMTLEAHRAWRRLLLTFGDPAPGPAPAGMRVFPPARAWLQIPSWEWHLAGVEAVRARTIAAAARVAGRMEEAAAMPPAEADRRLQAVPGIGPWTSAEVRQRACGDADAVSVGDYNLPALVGWALAGRVTDDAGMLDLLAPYAGHRHRVTRLVELSGRRPPRRGPRRAPRDYRAF
jgi:3-methyladenine DNA glycosylase/8-oxoguanine DNA glycosylase